MEECKYRVFVIFCQAWKWEKFCKLCFNLVKKYMQQSSVISWSADTWKASFLVNAAGYLAMEQLLKGLYSLFCYTLMLLHIILFISSWKWSQMPSCIKRPQQSRTLKNTGLFCSDFNSQEYHSLGREGKSCVHAAWVGWNWGSTGIVGLRKSPWS